MNKETIVYNKLIRASIPYNIKDEDKSIISIKTSKVSSKEELIELVINNIKEDVNKLEKAITNKEDILNISADLYESIVTILTKNGYSMSDFYDKINELRILQGSLSHGVVLESVTRKVDTDEDTN